MRRVRWSPELDHFLSQDLPRIIIIDGRLIIAGYLSLGRVPDRLPGDPALHPLGSKHRARGLLLRIFDLTRVRGCHHNAFSVISLFVIKLYDLFLNQIQSCSLLPSFIN
jgi:hypothetical protein